MKNQKVRKLTISALLIALGILIPMFMPRITIPPASFTLGSHIPVFLAMFISPGVAVVVSLGTAFGFFLSTTPIIAFRALSHVIFAFAGAWYLEKCPQIVLDTKKFMGFNGVIGMIHAGCELAIVNIFYFSGGMTPTFYRHNYVYTLLLLVGIGGLIHSIIDFTLAYGIAKQLSKSFDLPVFTKALATKKKLQKRQELSTTETV